MVAEGAAAPHLLAGLLPAGAARVAAGLRGGSSSGNILAAYTTQASLNPNHLSLRYARLLRTVQQAVASGAWPGGPRAAQ